MKLYRTCAPRTAGIEHFLDDLEEIHALHSILPTLDMVEEVFSRTASEDSSRFCPPQFYPIPLYASENDQTTFYEYCFHLLNNRKFISDKRPMKAALYFLQLTGVPRKKDITNTVPTGVMNKSSYAKAHEFIKKLKNFPDLIKYKSVRDKAKKINYAIYFQRYVTEVGIDPKTIIISLKSKDTVEVSLGADIYIIKPNI
jgi:hypothetical protein